MQDRPITQLSQVSSYNIPSPLNLALIPPKPPTNIRNGQKRKPYQRKVLVDIEKKSKKDDSSYPDSDYEYSADLMRNNPRGVSRGQKEQPRVFILSQFDWMIKTSKALGLSRTIYYRGIIIFRKFLIQKQKLQNPTITLADLRSYQVASISMASKLEDVRGGFLRNAMGVSDGNGQIPKERVIMAEVQIMHVIDFEIPLSIPISEVIVSVANQWNRFIFERESLSFSYFDLSQERIQSKQVKPFPFYQVFLFLADAYLMRKLSIISIKEMKEINEDQWYEQHLISVLYNMLLYQVQLQGVKNRVRELMRDFSQFTQIYYPTKRFNDLYCRKSMLLFKQIQRIFKVYHHQQQLQYSLIFKRAQENEKRIKELRERGVVVSRDAAMVAQQRPQTTLSHAQLSIMQERNQFWQNYHLMQPLQAEDVKIRVVIDNQPFTSIVGRLSIESIRELLSQRTVY